MYMRSAADMTPDAIAMFNHENIQGVVREELKSNNGLYYNEVWDRWVVDQFEPWWSERFLTDKELQEWIQKTRNHLRMQLTMLGASLIGMDDDILEVVVRPR